MREQESATGDVHVAFSFCVEYKNKNNGKVKRPEVVQVILDAVNEAKEQVCSRKDEKEGAAQEQNCVKGEPEDNEDR